MQNMENNSAIIEPTIDDISSETLEKVGDMTYSPRINAGVSSINKSSLLL